MLGFVFNEGMLFYFICIILFLFLLNVLCKTMLDVCRDIGVIDGTIDRF